VVVLVDFFLSNFDLIMFKSSATNLKLIHQKTLSSKFLSGQQFQAKLSNDEIDKIHKENLNPVLKTLYRKPLIIKNGLMQYVYDNENKRYLDMFAGIVTTSVGHCHPVLVDKFKSQAEKLWHVSSLYNAEETHEYVRKLATKFPPRLNSFFLCNSGSEANELAVLISRLYTKANDIIAVKNAYHGCSPVTLGLNGIGEWKHKVTTSLGIHHVTNPDVYRGRYGDISCRESMFDDHQECNCKSPLNCGLYVEDFEEDLTSLIAKDNFAAFIIESIQGVGGTVQYPRDYLKKVASIIKKHGGLLISDEVQTGFGRTGKNFWGFQNHQVEPDIVTMAKGIGNGFPLAAVCTTKEIAAALDRAKFFNTYGGNPLASVVGKTVLEIIDEERLQENCLKTGKLLLAGLNKLKDKYEVIGDVRGLGLMVGVEMVANRETKEPLAASKMNQLLEECKDLGLLIGKGGPQGSVLRIKPPMIINKDDVEFTIDCLDKVLKNIKPN